MHVKCDSTGCAVGPNDPFPSLVVTVSHRAQDVVTRARDLGRKPGGPHRNGPKRSSRRRHRSDRFHPGERARKIGFIGSDPSSVGHVERVVT